jgi:polysaccharide pyruvyl transferase WcaK-like protein
VGDIHGGDSFSDIYGLNRFFYSSNPNIIVLLMRKRLVQLPQTYGPYYSSTAKFVTRSILQHSYNILSRDKASIEVIANLLGNNACINKKIEFCPDVAFVLDSIKVKNPRINPPLRQINNMPLVGINVNGLMYNGGYNKNNMFGLKLDYKKFIEELVSLFMNKNECSFVVCAAYIWAQREY